MELLSATLTAFSRLLEGLRFAAVVPLVDEFLGYLEVCFQWAPSLSLDAALNVSCVDFETTLLVSTYYILEIVNRPVEQSAVFYLKPPATSRSPRPSSGQACPI